MIRHLLLCIALAGCVANSEPAPEKTALAIGQERLVESGQGPIGTIDPSTLHLLVASYPISCAEPWGSVEQHTYTKEECDAAPEQIDWQLDLLVPGDTNTGVITLDSIISTIFQGKCGTEGADAFNSFSSGTLDITTNASSAVNFELSGTDPLSDGTYTATRCP